MGMLTDYIRAAMKRATYEILENNEGFFGSIPECRGAWSNEPTLEACRDELESVLQSWIFIKLRHNDDDFVVIDGNDLNPQAGYVDPADEAVSGAA